MKGSRQGNNRDTGASIVDIPLYITAAHELKSPLALIRQLALSLESGECTPAEATRIARQITLTSERALRLTTDLTRAARLEGSLFSSLEPISPLSLCEDVVHELQPLYRAKGRVLTVKRHTRPLLGLANKDLLRRVLLNFVDNALAHTDTNTPVVMSARTYRSGTRIRLGVRDYGPALAPDIWRRLEASLGSSPQPLPNRPGSSGLGIYIANQFAEAMGAQVGATRHRDGATFYIDISASQQLRLL